MHSRSTVYSVGARLALLPTILEPLRHSLPIAIAGGLLGFLSAIAVFPGIAPASLVVAGFVTGGYSFSLSCHRSGDYPMTAPAPADPPPTLSSRFAWFTVLFLLGGGALAGLTHSVWTPLLLPSYLVAFGVTAVQMTLEAIRIGQYGRVPVALLSAGVAAVVDAVKVFIIAVVVSLLFGPHGAS